MSHPSRDELLHHAFDDVGQSRDVSAHLATCERCRAEIARLRWGASLLRGNRWGSDESTLDCLDDDAVAWLVADGENAEARDPLVAHLAACERCRSRVASVARALADPMVRREIEAVEAGDARRPAGRRALLTAGLAAAAVLLFAVLPRAGDDGTSAHRAPTITALPVPAPTAPVGAVAEAVTLRWAAAAGADRYRVTLFDAEGDVLYESQVADTMVVLPDSIALEPGRSYLWKVDARTGWERWAASELVEFSISPEGPR